MWAKMEGILMAKHKIGWCDVTWNSVWGCKNHCEYCYARKIAKRFADKIALKEFKHYLFHSDIDILQDWDDVRQIGEGEFANRLRHFKPTFLHSQFNKKLPKKPQKIFVGSMSEIADWKVEWVEMVLKKIKQYP